MPEKTTVSVVKCDVGSLAGHHTVPKLLLDIGETDPFNASDYPSVTLPVASFEYYPSYPKINDTITFNASSSFHPDGTIVSYEWDFDDGNTTTVTDPVIIHTYSTPRNYTVTLKVTDDEGFWNITSIDVYVGTQLLGDINRDGIVDIFDVVTVSLAFGSKLGDLNWNPIADVAEPYGEIDIFDVVTVTMNFGKTA